MRIGRYRRWTPEVWAKCWKRRKAACQKRAAMPFWPDMMWEMDARLILEAYYRGLWRAIWALLTHELHEVWVWYGWPRWEWIRTRIFRRSQNADLAEWERWDEEDAAVEELAKQL